MAPAPAVATPPVARDFSLAWGEKDSLGSERNSLASGIQAMKSRKAGTNRFKASSLDTTYHAYCGINKLVVIFVKLGVDIARWTRLDCVHLQKEQAHVECRS